MSTLSEEEIIRISDEQFIRELENGKLTPVSDGTVNSAFSESEQIDFELGSDITPPPPKRKPGRPKGSTNSKRLKAIEALFEDPNIIIGTGRRKEGTTTPSRQLSSTSPNSVFLLSPESEFRRACQYGQLNIIETILRKGIVNANARDSGMNTPLHEAAVHGQLEVVKLLLKMGADVNSKNLLKQKASFLTSDPEIKKILLDFEIYSAEQEFSHRFLRACWDGNAPAVENCLKDGVDINISDFCGNIGLHYAAIFNHGEITRLLLAKGIQKNFQNKSGNTPLHEASRFSSGDVVKILLENNCDYSILNLDKNSALHYASKLTRRVFRRFARETGINDPEFLSATETKRFVEISDYDEENNEDNEDGQLDLKSKGITREERKLQQMLNILSKSNQSFSENKSTPVKRKRGRPPLNSAIVTDEDSSTTSPLPKVRSSENNYAKLGLGKFQGRTKIDPNYIDKSSGRTQLHKFAANGKLEELRELIKVDKSLIKKRDNGGYMALHEACLRGHLNIVKVLIDNGSKANARAENGDTPLHDAAENGHVEIVKYLISNGANVGAVNKDGKTPLDVAMDDETAKAIKSSHKSGQNNDRSHKFREKEREKLISESEEPPVNQRHRKKKTEKSKIVDSGFDSIFGGGEMVEIFSKDPLIQIHCPETETDSAGWYYMEPQIQNLFVRFSRDRVRDTIPLSKTRLLQESDIKRLSESTIFEKLHNLRQFLSVDSLILLDREAVLRVFEKSGGNLSNVPVMYLDLQRLLNKSRNNEEKEGKETNDSGGYLPPKLKMKWQRKTSTDAI